jgi:hypothetical protein
MAFDRDPGRFAIGRQLPAVAEEALLPGLFA